MILIPIGDDNPREKFPFVNATLLATNIIVFLLACFPQPSEAVLISYGMRPAHLDLPTLFTSMFLHANLLHLAGNMIFLWIFGDNVEDKLGHVLYAVFYLGWGLAADGLHILSNPASAIPAIGASGAISGVVGAYVVFFPRHRVRLFYWIYFIADVVRVPAFWWIGIWFLEQLVFAVAHAGGGVAYFAHIGGFLGGVAVAALWKFALFPSRFGHATALPSGVAAASRLVAAPAGSRRFAAPTVEGTDETADSFAVLRAGDGGGEWGLGRLVAGTTGEPLDLVEHRLRTTRGLIARNLDRPTAERLAGAVRRSGVASLVVPDTAATRPPFPIDTTGVTWRRDGLAFQARGLRQASWDEPFLVIAAQAGSGPLLDIFLRGGGRFRITAATPLRYVAGSHQYPARLNHLATAIAQVTERRAILNEGVRVLAAGGRWGWLEFPSEAEYEDYVFWLYNLVRR